MPTAFPATHSSGVSQSLLLLATKLYIPPIRPELISRPPLIERLIEDCTAS